MEVPSRNRILGAEMRNDASHFAPLHKHGIVQLTEDLIVYEEKTHTTA